MTMSMMEGKEKYFSFNDDELLIDKETDDVAYNDEKHIYVGKRGNTEGKKYTSVTTLIGMYENEFDAEFWKRYKALQELMGDRFDSVKKMLLDKKVWDNKYIPSDIDMDTFNATCQKYVDEWAAKNKEACEVGTRIHAAQETGFYTKSEKMIEKFKLGGSMPVAKNCHEFKYDTAIHPEMLLSYQSEDGILRIAGQSDLVIKNGNKIRILDYKTNAKLDKKSYFDPKKKKYQMMKYPINNIMDCNLQHYTLQLSIYAWIIQKLHPEYEIEELRIIHFTHDGDVNEYVLDYLKSDVERLLKHYKKQLMLKQYEDDNKPVIF